MQEKIKVAIADDQQAVLDGYIFRLEKSPGIEVVATTRYGEEVERMVTQHKANVLLLDVQMPTSEKNNHSYPILHIISLLLRTNPKLAVLVISMHDEHTMIQAVMEAGASGYILKQDYESIIELASIVRSLASGGVYLSPKAYQNLYQAPQDNLNSRLSPRQLEVLSLCSAYPDASTAEMAARLHIKGSTLRTLLSNAYLKLGVRTRAAAVDKARSLRLITPFTQGGSPDITSTNADS